MTPPPPSRRKKSRAKPRFLTGCKVLFQQGIELLPGEVESVQSLQGRDPIYNIQCDSTGKVLGVAQSQLQFAPKCPVWVSTKAGSRPGLVHSPADPEGKYKIKMLADHCVVSNISVEELRYNFLQAAIQEKLRVKQEDQEEEHLGNNKSKGSGASSIIVKQEPEEETTTPSTHVKQEPEEDPTPDSQQNIIPATSNTPDDAEEEPSSDAEEEPRELTPEELLELRQKNLPKGYILNQATNHFCSIVYSSKHNVPEAVEKVRNYIQTYGAGDIERYGGLGPILYHKCLRWHLQGQCRQGQCRRSCEFFDDHFPLSQGEALIMEAALEPAMSPEGPIYPPEVILAAEEEDDHSIVEEDTPPPVEVAAPTRPRDPRQRPCETTNHTANDNPQKRQRRTFQCQEPLSLLVPSWFGRDFYLRALQETKNKQNEYGCHCDLQTAGRMTERIIIQGDETAQMEQFKSKIPGFLCQGLPRKRKNLRGKLLWDLNRLGNVNEGDIISVENDLEEGTKYLTVIPLGATTKDGTLNIEDGKDKASKLDLSYKNTEYPCTIHVHIKGGSQQFALVPSHIVVWSESESSVQKCRTDFFKQIQQEDECW